MMKPMYLILANLVALTHGALVLTVVFGSIYAAAGRMLGRPLIEISYLLLLGTIIFSEFVVQECTLTTLEKYLRELHEPGSAYRNAFLTHYLYFIPRQIIIWGGYIVVSTGIAGMLFWRLVDLIRKKA